MTTIQRPRGMDQRTFERIVGEACQGTGVTPLYNPRSADLYGSEADQMLARLALPF